MSVRIDKRACLRNLGAQVSPRPTEMQVHRGEVDATLLWRTGAQEQPWLEQPLNRRGGKVPWTEEDNNWLQQHCATASLEALQARFPHRTVMAMRKQAATLGLKRPHHGTSKPKGAGWTESENVRLRAHAAGTISYTELCGSSPVARGMRSKRSGLRWA
jgi:hypothetical protein